NEAWEKAILDYKKHLNTFRDRMTSGVVALSELCLHDAELLARSENFQADGPLFPDYPLPCSIWSAVAVLTVQIDGEILSLFYSLRDRVEVRQPPENWPFSKLSEHWLYDEIHLQPADRWPLYT